MAGWIMNGLPEKMRDRLGVKSENIWGEKKTFYSIKVYWKGRLIDGSGEKYYRDSLDNTIDSSDNDIEKIFST